MEPEAPARDDTFTRRHARRALGVLLASFAVLLAVPVIDAVRVWGTLRRVNASGGFVLAEGSPLPLPPHWPGPIEERFLALYPIRDAYEVTYGTSTGQWCGTGVTLAMGPDPAGDPGDAGLAAVADLERTRSLALRDTSVSDVGLVALHRLARLERLDLEGTRVTGPGLAHVTSRRLHTLSLAHTPIDDEGLRHLPDLPALASLDLRGTRVSGPGLAELARLPALRDLYLEGPFIDDDALRHLAGLHLERLSIEGPTVTDAAVPYLERLADLREVSLCGTRVTDGALARSCSKALRDGVARRALLCRR